MGRTVELSKSLKMEIIYSWLLLHRLHHLPPWSHPMLAICIKGKWLQIKGKAFLSCPQIGSLVRGPRPPVRRRPPWLRPTLLPLAEDLNGFECEGLLAADCMYSLHCCLSVSTRHSLES